MEDNQTQTKPNDVNDSKTYNVSITMDSKKWAMLCHASAFSGFFIPFGHILGPMIIWQLKKDEIKAVEENGRAALNFQLFVTALAFGIMALSMILMIVFIGPIVGMLGYLGLIAFTVYYTAMAAMAAYKGEHFKYPYTYEFVKQNSL